MKFPYLLFDADDTLFDFSKSRGPCLFCHVPEQRRSGYAGYPRPLPPDQPGAVGSL